MIKPRKISCLITLVVFVVLLEGSARRAYASPQDQGQGSGQQQGSFAVGHTTRVLDLKGTRGETRHVNVHLWYPAPTPQNCQSGNAGSQGCPPSVYTSPASVYTSRLNGISLLPVGDPLSWTIGSTQSFEELPISSEESSYPIIIFSHGNQNNAIDYVYTLEPLASFGFIVAAPDHVNNTQDDVRIDLINAKAGKTLIPCFDSFSTPCEITARVKAANMGNDPSVSCPTGSLIPSTTASVLESFKDRVADVSAIIDMLPTWFGSRADTSRVGVMGHSRGTVTALTAAGGSACWGISADSRVKAIMGLSIGLQNVTSPVDLSTVTVPTLLVSGLLDKVGPLSVSQFAYSNISSADKALVTIPNAKHRHFDSGLCAQTKSSGVIVEANPLRAILDRQTVINILIPPNPSGVPMDYCGLDTFFDTVNTPPTYDIRLLVLSLTGFTVTSNPVNVPTTGLTSNQVKDQVVQLAVGFFRTRLEAQ